ncbi:MAG: sugar transferase [Clostridiales bacterium]|nr:sugar transferase [Clostridiales bacterium]
MLSVKPYLVAKRILDFILSLIGLVILSPLLLIICLLIKLDSKGPVFFTQERLGYNGKIFRIYKFRTMVDGAINMGSGLFTNEADPRITRVGSFLRKTSLDEIPQLINVLRGEMSWVGPRPPVPYHPYKYEDYQGDQKIRFTVLPGITGYAQISGRNKLDWNERINLDVKYAKNQSIFLDIRIMFKTIQIIFLKDGIY